MNKVLATICANIIDLTFSSSLTEILTQTYQIHVNMNASFSDSLREYSSKESTAFNTPIFKLLLKLLMDIKWPSEVCYCLACWRYSYRMNKIMFKIYTLLRYTNTIILTNMNTTRLDQYRWSSIQDRCDLRLFNFMIWTVTDYVWAWLLHVCPCSVTVGHLGRFLFHFPAVQADPCTRLVTLCFLCVCLCIRNFLPKPIQNVCKEEIVLVYSSTSLFEGMDGWHMMPFCYVVKFMRRKKQFTQSSPCLWKRKQNYSSYHDCCPSWRH